MKANEHARRYLDLSKFKGNSVDWIGLQFMIYGDPKTLIKHVALRI